MRKRLFVIMLTVALAVSFLTMPVVAEADEATILQILSIMEVMVGDENGNLNLGNYVTRAEFSKLAVSASLFKDAATAVAHVSPFPDVRSTHWAAGYVKTAVEAGWVTGYLDGTFLPDNAVKLEEAVTVVLKVLGYTDADFTGTYPNGQLALYRSLKLNKNITAAQGSTLTRRDCAHLIYNTLTAKNRNQIVHATTLGYGTDANGDIDYLALLNTKMDGPVIVPAAGSVSSLIGFTPRLVYRNGSVVSAEAVAPYDVVYYTESLGTIWISSAKAHGIYESAAPNVASPTSVTVSGKTYTVGTVSARLALSAVGEFSIGDNVTLLLGLDGAVAGVMSPSTDNRSVAGLVIGNGTRQFTNSDGSSYSSHYAKVVTTGGQIFEYATPNNNIGIGKIVTVQFSGGVATVTAITTTSRQIYGKVNASATKMGDYSFADNIEIMDVYEGEYAIMNSTRLKSVDITQSMVLYYRMNGAGEIERLILKDATGDLYAYGILTSYTESSGGLSVGATYNYVSGGQSKTHRETGKKYNNISVGPIMIRTGKDKAVDLIKNLTSVRLTGLTDTTATGSFQTYILSETVEIYERVGVNEYLLSSVGHLENNGMSGYEITGYMDKPESDGGRIRVVIVAEKSA